MAVRLISHINALVLLLYIYRLYLLCLENNIGKFTTNNNIKKGISTCGSFACICGLCVRVWISRVHLWEDLILFSLHNAPSHVSPVASLLLQHITSIVTKTFCIKYINNVGLQVPVITSKLVAVYNTFLEI